MKSPSKAKAQLKSPDTFDYRLVTSNPMADFPKISRPTLRKLKLLEAISPFAWLWRLINPTLNFPNLPAVFSPPSRGIF